MRSSNLINEASVTRALHDILQGLDDSGLLRQFDGLVGNYHVAKGVREFPEFTLLSPGRRFAPYKWFLPKPRVSIPEFLRIYDQFADAVQGSGDNPAAVASKIYTRQSESGRLLTHFSHESQWLGAGHTLLCAALWLGAELEQNLHASLRMRLGTGLLEVTPNGVWSNTQRKMLQASAVPAGHMWPLVPFPLTRSDNPVLHVFSTLRDRLDPSLQFAATLVAIALKEEVVNRGFVRAVVEKHTAKILSASRRSPDKVEAATAALQQCTEILEEAEEGVVQALYEAAVPRLMPAARFRSMFGVASQDDPGREVKASTRARWRVKLEQEFVRLEDAVI